MQELFKIILTAIIGGLALYYIPKWIKIGVLKFRPILTYQFDDDGTDKGPRRIHHSFGTPVKDEDASNGKAWEHNSISINNGLATCYGPYTKEISLRGKYKARFRIKAIGIKNHSAPLVVLDIAHGERDGNGNFVMLGLPLVEKELKGKDLTGRKYKNVDLKFDYDGQSLIEFRCSVMNPQGYKQNIERILFDNIKIFQLAEMI